MKGQPNTQHNATDSRPCNTTKCLQRNTKVWYTHHDERTTTSNMSWRIISKLNAGWIFTTPLKFNHQREGSAGRRHTPSRPDPCNDASAVQGGSRQCFIKRNFRTSNVYSGVTKWYLSCPVIKTYLVLHAMVWNRISTRLLRYLSLSQYPLYKSIARYYIWSNVLTKS